MVYTWFMRTLHRWRTPLLLFLTRNSNDKKTIGPAPRDIPYLPSDVIIDILSRLPAECVLKCRQVCKRWLVLTSSPHFTEMHRKRVVPVLVLQMATEFESSKRAAYSHDLHIFDDHATDFKLKVPQIGSFHMLGTEKKAVLLGSGNGFLVFELDYLSYLVLNLVTREHDTIKQQQPVKKESELRVRRSWYWTWCGILFHIGIRENILIFWREMECGKFSFGIYMLSRKLWKQASTSSYRPNHSVDPIVFNNRLHWMSTSFSCRSSIISCDMNVEGFGSLSHPGEECHSLLRTHTSMCLLEHEGKLAFGCYRDPRIAIWVLEDYDTWSWSLKYNVNLRSDVKGVPRKDLRLHGVGLVEYLRIVNCELIFYWRGVGIVGYHLERKTTRMFDAPSFKKRCPWVQRCNLVSYMKCLVPL